MTIVEKIDALQARLAKARAIVKDGAIWPIHKDENARYVAKSQENRKGANGLPKLYLVGPESCTCADYRELREHNGGWCKHRLARELALNGDAEGRDTVADETPAPDNQTVAPQPTSNKERYEQAQAKAEARQREAEATVGSV